MTNAKLLTAAEEVELYKGIQILSTAVGTWDLIEVKTSQSDPFLLLQTVLLILICHYLEERWVNGVISLWRDVVIVNHWRVDISSETRIRVETEANAVYPDVTVDVSRLLILIFAPLGWLSSASVIQLGVEKRRNQTVDGDIVLFSCKTGFEAAFVDTFAESSGMLGRSLEELRILLKEVLSDI
ncbi:hypothetical protein Tco_0829948 [Tanacetum coccineum]